MVPKNKIINNSAIFFDVGFSRANQISNAGIKSTWIRLKHTRIKAIKQPKR